MTQFGVTTAMTPCPAVKTTTFYFGGNGNDRIAGDDYGAIIGGSTGTPSGDDYVDGGLGNDVIYGDGGADVVVRR